MTHPATTAEWSAPLVERLPEVTEAALDFGLPGGSDLGTYSSID